MKISGRPHDFGAVQLTGRDFSVLFLVAPLHGSFDRLDSQHDNTVLENADSACRLRNGNGDRVRGF